MQGGGIRGLIDPLPKKRLLNAVFEANSTHMKIGHFTCYSPPLGKNPGHALRSAYMHYTKRPRFYICTIDVEQASIIQTP